MSLPDDQPSLLEGGYIDLNDSTVGDLVSQMERRRFPFLSKWGLTVCKQSIFGNKRIIEAIETSLGQCRFGHWLRYAAYPGHIESYRFVLKEEHRGGEGKKEPSVLVIHQLAKGSRLVFYRGSHFYDPPMTLNDRRLHEADREELERAGYVAEPVDYPDGGLIIRDNRLFAEIEKGYAITLLFAKEDALASWPKLDIENDPELIRIVVQMETRNIRVNFQIANTSTKKI